LAGASNDLEGLSAFPSESIDDTAIEPQADPRVSQPMFATRDSVPAHSPVSRWLRAIAAAFGFGALSTLVALQILDSRSNTASVLARIDAPAVSDGIPVTLLADVDRVEVRPPVPTARPRRVAPQRVIAAETGNVVALDVKPDEIVTAYSEPAAPTMVPASDVQSAASDEQAVRQKLRAYESYQGAGFRACSVVVSAEHATAECHGSITQTAGPDSPSSSSEHQWTFKMRRDGETWKIDEVSRSSPMDAPRTPGHE
jgi:hypothetical protein